MPCHVDPVQSHIGVPRQVVQVWEKAINFLSSQMMLYKPPLPQIDDLNLLELINHSRKVVGFKFTTQSPLWAEETTLQLRECITLSAPGAPTPSSGLCGYLHSHLCAHMHNVKNIKKELKKSIVHL